MMVNEDLPGVTGVAIVAFPPGAPVIVLDRVVPDRIPPYCIHGRVTCMGVCGQWLLLGHASHEEVKNRKAIPMCKECLLPLVTAKTWRDGHINDHLRSEGPH